VGRGVERFFRRVRDAIFPGYKMMKEQIKQQEKAAKAAEEAANKALAKAGEMVDGEGGLDGATPITDAYVDIGNTTEVEPENDAASIEGDILASIDETGHQDPGGEIGIDANIGDIVSNGALTDGEMPIFEDPLDEDEEERRRLATA